MRTSTPSQGGIAKRKDIPPLLLFKLSHNNAKEHVTHQLKSSKSLPEPRTVRAV